MDRVLSWSRAAILPTTTDFVRVQLSDGRRLNDEQKLHGNTRERVIPQSTCRIYSK